VREAFGKPQAPLSKPGASLQKPRASFWNPQRHFGAERRAEDGEDDTEFRERRSARLRATIRRQDVALEEPNVTLTIAKAPLSMDGASLSA
jgi:hypothetical protein